ncbi:MAG: MBL fold metallo-hydrolase [Actinomycetota bacterium]|nr:MBL fold metallo-hydrolase [Actinomycetota bacterium]
MEAFTKLFEDGSAVVNRCVVGDLDNNVYIVTSKSTGESILIDAADEGDYLEEFAKALKVRTVLETHGHYDHIGAVEHLRDAGFEVVVGKEDAFLLPSYDLLAADGEAYEFGGLTIENISTPGHTDGSFCFYLHGSNFLFTGDTLFPGGPGATHFPGGNFGKIMDSLTDRLFNRFSDDVIILPGHGRYTTFGSERPHLEEWALRGD